MSSKCPAVGRASRHVGRGIFASWLLRRLTPALVLLACCLGPRQAAGDTTESQRHVSGIDALELETKALAETITNQIETASNAASEKAGGHSNLLLDVLLVLGGFALLTKLGIKWAEIADRRHDQRVATGAATSAELAAEEKSFAEFAAAFSSGAVSRSPRAACESSEEESFSAAKAGTKPPASPRKESDFPQQTAKRLSVMRKLFSEIGRVPGEAAQQRILSQVGEEVRGLRQDAEAAAARPVWQMAAALDGLLHQFVERANTVTPSSLRTLASAIDLLHGLGRHGLDGDLATEPPVKLLVVDDDAISRHAMAFALKKVFNPPDVAPNGEAALVLAEANAYDVVFLDIQMPGMDGFELCSRIHGTLPNATTPVVFVTCCSDFDARARSGAIGGQDLLGKPFLTFELAVKALTLVLRRRLEARTHASRCAVRPTIPKPLAPEPAVVKALEPAVAA